MASPDELALDASLRLSETVPPQVAAAAMEAETELGIPRDVAQRNPQQVQAIQQRRAQPPTAQILKESPYLAEFMLDPTDAAVARPDIPNLMDLERRINSADIPTARNLVNLLGNSANRLTGNFLQVLGQGTEMLRHIESAIRYPGGEGMEASMASGEEVNRMRDLARGLRGTGVAVAEGEAYEYTPEFTVERMLTDPSIANIIGTFAEQGIVGSGPDMVAAAVLPYLYAATLSNQIAVERAKNDGGTAEDVDLGDLVAQLPMSAAITAVDRFSTMGMLGVLADSKSIGTAREVATEMMKAAGREAGTEFVQEGAQALAETVGTSAYTSTGIANYDSTELHEFADILAGAAWRGVEGAIVGGMMGVGIRGTTASYQAVAQNRTRAATTRLMSQFDQADLDQQLTLLADNTMRQTSMPRFQEFLNTVSDGKRLYLAPDVLAEVQAAGIELPFLQGTAPDADIEVSYQDIAGVVDQPEVMKVLRPYLKRNPTLLSQAELKEAGDDPSVQALVEAAARDTQLRTQVDAIYKQVVNQIIATGRQSGETARFSAELIPAYVTTKVAELRAQGIEVTPREVFETMGLRIEKMGAPTAGAVLQEKWHHGGTWTPGQEPTGPLFLAKREEDAQWFATDRGGKISTVAVDVKNPLVVEDKAGFDALIEIAREAGVEIETDNGGFYSPTIAEHSPNDGFNALDLLYIPAVREAVAAKGYDAVRATDSIGNDNSVPVLVPLTARVAAADSTMRQEAPVFRSALVDSVTTDTSSPRKGTGQQWSAWLDGRQRAGSLKKAERDWLGVDAWLDGRESTTREELQQYVEAHQIHVEDVVLGGSEKNLTVEQAQEIIANGGQVYTVDRNNPEMIGGAVLKTNPPQLLPYIVANPDAYYLREGNPDDAIKRKIDTKFSQYQLPGGENYRELLLTLPSESTQNPSTITEMNDEQLADFIIANDRNAEVEGLNRANLLQLVDSMELTDVDLNSFLKKGKVLNRAAGTFKSSHFDQPNILAHVRFNERTDADGKRVLFLEEIQSDWAQKGRKDGFKQELNPEDVILDDVAADVYFFTAPSGAHFRINAKSETEARARAIEVVKENSYYNTTGDVPNMPFKNTDEWSMLAFKRMVRYAAENGFDKIAWTTGDQQAARYDLSKQVERIVVPMVDTDGRSVRIDPVDGTSFKLVVGTDGTVTKGYYGADQFTGKPLSDVIGKEVADKVMAAESGAELAGVDLKVGGEGMRGFYDKILPAAVNKWAKKFGGKVERISTSTYEKGNPRAMEGAGIEDGVTSNQGITLTPTMREAALAGQPLFQEGPTVVQGETQLLDDGAILRLGNASDLSTFLHEAAHVFLHAEARFAAKYGTTPSQQAILEFLGVTSFEQIAREQHEVFARTFEDYLRTGKAPSLRLRDAFAAFSRWLVKVYQGLLRIPGAKALSPEITGVFDRMLATQVEMDEAAAGAEYQQYFRDQKQAGVSDAEWKRYLELVQKRRDRSQMDLQDKLIEQFRRMRTQDWKDERRAMYDEELAKQESMPINGVMAALAEEKLDAAAVRVIRGDDALPGRLASLSRDSGGIDPTELAEQYGYDSAAQMLEEIANYTRITKGAAMEAAEARMLEKYGDILNDGTIEAEAREAFQNDVHAELLLTEIKMLNRTARPRKAPDIDRDQLKAQAAAAVSKMRASAISPDRFYRAEVRAARKAAKAKTPAEARAAKIAQLVNHYLYREAVQAQRDYAKARAYVTSVRSRKYSTWHVNPVFIQQMKMLAKMYDTTKAGSRSKMLGRLVEWYEAQLPANPDLTLMDPTLIRALAERKAGTPATWSPLRFSELSVDEVRGVYEQLRHLRFIGGKSSLATQDETRAIRQAGIDSVIANGGKDLPAFDGPQEGDELREKLWHFVNLLPSLRNLARKLDGFKDGWAYEHIFAPLTKAYDTKLRLTRETYDAYAAELATVSNLGLGRGKAHSVTQTKADGTTWTLDAEHRVMLALYWGHEYAREAVRKGHRVTDADVEAMLATLTADQVQMVNAVWKINESLWPEMSAASARRYGTAPARTTAIPFTVGPHTFTGGHMRLYYARTAGDVELKPGETFTTTGLAPGKAGSLHDLTGQPQEGKGNFVKVLLDKNNIFRALDENIHFVAFSDTGVQMQRILGNVEFQATIARKHGKGFLRALNESVAGITTNRQNRDGSAVVADIARTLRKARTFGFLAYSIRNTVQQWAATPIILRDLGAAAYSSHVLKFYTPGKAMANRAFVTGKSQFMNNRASLVNREAAEFLQTVTVEGKPKQMWEAFKNYGFAPQTIVDMMLAFPAWMAKYEAEMGEHNDEARAVRNADTLVAETVGSGADIHLGTLYRKNQTELTKTLTAFGSWFNSYFNRMYRATKGGTEWVTWEALDAMFTTPVMVAVMSATLVMDGPDEDDSLLWWVTKKYAGFMAGTLPYLRDMVSALNGFTPSAPHAGVAEFPKAVWAASKQIYNDTEGAAGDAAALVRVASSVRPIPGAGNITRVGDYIESYEQGNEDRIDGPGSLAAEAYQAVVEGPDRND